VKREALDVRQVAATLVGEPETPRPDDQFAVERRQWIGVRLPAAGDIGDTGTAHERDVIGVGCLVVEPEIFAGPRVAIVVRRESEAVLAQASGPIQQRMKASGLEVFERDDEIALPGRRNEQADVKVHYNVHPAWVRCHRDVDEHAWWIDDVRDVEDASPLDGNLGSGHACGGKQESGSHRPKDETSSGHRRTDFRRTMHDTQPGS